MTDQLGLTEAWAVAEASLPEYWRIRSLIEVPGPLVAWEVVATDSRRIVVARGATPDNALINLAVEFRGRPA
jgi:hypothetical protein